MLDLLIDYYDAKNRTLEMINRCTDEDEMKILKSIYNEMDYITKWIKSGHNPSDWKIDNNQCYLVDHKTLEAVIDSDSMYRKISPDEYGDYINGKDNLISKALSKLSKRELEVFLLMKCERLTDGYVSDLLNIKRGAVNSYLIRAQSKVNNFLFSSEINNLIIELRLNKTIFDYLIMKYEIQVDETKVSLLGEDTKEKQVIDYILTQLSKNEYKTYLMHEVKGMKYKEVSELLGISEATVIKNNKTATKKLNDFFEQVPMMNKEVLI